MGKEPMTLGSPASPKPATGAQFLPGYLMGDLPAPVSPQPRAFAVASGIGLEMRSPLIAASGMFSPSTIGQQRKATLSPAQVDPFYTQGDALSSEDHLDDTWVTVFGFPPASASYILLQFAQYGNVLKHVMSNNGNWMHIQYQSKLQARKALSKDGKIFGETIMIGVKPCIDKSVMENVDHSIAFSSSSAFTPVKSSGTPSSSVNTPRSTSMRPLAAAYKASSSDYQVKSSLMEDRRNRGKEGSFHWIGWPSTISVVKWPNGGGSLMAEVSRILNKSKSYYVISSNSAPYL
ncbi:NUP35 protein, partial [Polypterus senegalus]